MRRSDPQGTILYIGRRGGPEAQIAARQGLDVRLIPAAGLNRDHWWRNWRLPLTLPVAFGQALAAVRAFHPHVMLGTGGYVAAPVVAAARVSGVPVVLQEQNVRPGWATRLAVPAAWAIAVGFAETATRVRAARVITTGNPVRDEFAVPAQPPARVQHILVMGGSQGARHLNDVLLAALPRLLERPLLTVTHLTGERDFRAVQARAQTLPEGVRARYRLEAFCSDMAPVVRATDLVVSRAGAMTIAEAAALGRPLILVPGAFGGGHQVENARAVQRAGAAVVIADRDLSPDRLLQEIGALCDDGTRFAELCRASRAFGRPHASDAVVAMLRQAAG